MPPPQQVTDEVKQSVEEKKSRTQKHFRGAKKQFVRREGWLPRARLRKAKIQQSGRIGPLKYFTLCGGDALDVLHLACRGVLEFDGRGYPGVVFCEAEDDFFADIVSRLGRTLGHIPDHLEDVVLDADNPYHADFEQLIAFDIINLDFSNVCFPRRDAPYSRTLRALRRIIALQGTAGADFDLFVTFRAERAIENKEALQQLKRNLQENFPRIQEVRELFSAKHGPVESLLDRDYARFLLATFPKLIVRYGNDENYKVTCADEYFYRRRCRHKVTGKWTSYRIVKFLFTFDFEPPSTGIVQAGPTRSEALAESYADEIKHAISMDATDVDARLRSNESLKTDLRLEVHELLTTTPSAA